MVLFCYMMHRLRSCNGAVFLDDASVSCSFISIPFSAGFPLPHFSHNCQFFPHARSCSSPLSTKGETKEILHGVSGEIKPGELCCIIGPSGAGKTSLMDCLAGRIQQGISVDSIIELDGKKLYVLCPPSIHFDRISFLIVWVIPYDPLFCCWYARARVWPAASSIFLASSDANSFYADMCMFDAVNAMLKDPGPCRQAHCVRRARRLLVLNRNPKGMHGLFCQLAAPQINDS